MQQRVEPLRGIGEQGAGGRGARVACMVAGEPVQREPYPVDQLVGLCRRAKPAQPDPAVGHRDGVQRVVEMNEFKQRGIAERAGGACAPAAGGVGLDASSAGRRR